MKLHNFNDLTGQKFDMLLVLAPDGTNRGRAYFRCVCDCGTEKRVRGANLRLGSVRSCGCLKKYNRVGGR